MVCVLFLSFVYILFNFLGYNGSGFRVFVSKRTIMFYVIFFYGVVESMKWYDVWERILVRLKFDRIVWYND